LLERRYCRRLANSHRSHHAESTRAVTLRDFSETFAIVIAISAATPWPQSQTRGVANLLLRASLKASELMRPTGEASGPVSGEIVCRLVNDRC
jgi:hypothetical protein